VRSAVANPDHDRGQGGPGEGPGRGPAQAQLPHRRTDRAWVTDFTYVATWAGFVYVAFAIDLFSRSIVGWSIATVKDVAFVEACLKMALWRRDQHGQPVPPGMVHHSDAGSQG